MKTQRKTVIESVRIATNYLKEREERKLIPYYDVNESSKIIDG